MRISQLCLACTVTVISSCGVGKSKVREGKKTESWDVMLQNTLDTPVEVTITELNVTRTEPAIWVKVEKTIPLAALESKAEILVIVDQVTRNKFDETRHGGSIVNFAAATLDSYTVCQLAEAIYKIRAKSDACAQDEIKVAARITHNIEAKPN